MHDSLKEVTKDFLKAVFPVGVSVTGFAGIPWQQWVYIVTAIYTVFLIIKTGISILRSFPKVYGCIACFKRNWKCPRNCRDFAN